MGASRPLSVLLLLRSNIFVFLKLGHAAHLPLQLLFFNNRVKTLTSFCYRERWAPRGFLFPGQTRCRVPMAGPCTVGQQTSFQYVLSFCALSWLLDLQGRSCGSSNLFMPLHCGESSAVNVLRICSENMEEKAARCSENEVTCLEQMCQR